MQIGASPSEYGTYTTNQQNNQLIGKLPNWQSRLGAGTAGGDLNLRSLQSQNLGAGQNNLGDILRALLSKQGA